MKKRSPLTDDDGEVRELTEEDFRNARPAREVLPEILGEKIASGLFKRKPGQRGKQHAPKKELISIRLQADIVEFFKSQGPGWQARIDSALKEWVKEHRA